MLVQLIDTVRARFVEREFSEVVVDEGIDARNAQSNYGSGSANRVVFVPSSDGGTFISPTFIGEGDDDKRQLINMLMPFEVVVTAFDADSPERDMAHRRRCVDIFEIVVQEVQRAYYGAAVWTSFRWEDPRKVGRHGAELVSSLVINIPIFDVTWVTGTPAAVPGAPKPLPPPPPPEDP